MQWIERAGVDMEVLGANRLLAGFGMVLVQ